MLNITLPRCVLTLPRCVNPSQACVNPTQVYVNPSQACVNPTQVVPLDVAGMPPSRIAQLLRDSNPVVLVGPPRPLGLLSRWRLPKQGVLASRAVAESSRVSPPHRLREEGLTHPTDTSRSNLAAALAYVDWVKPEPVATPANPVLPYTQRTLRHTRGG
jgi:hypothetical protein